MVFPQTDPEIEAVEDTEEELPEADTNTEKPSLEVEKKNTRGRNGQFEIVSDCIPDGIAKMRYAGKKVKATGYYIEDTDEFVVLKGSEFSKTETNSCSASIRTMRQKLMDNGIIESYIFIQSVKFQSPSAAAQMVYGGSQNGRNMWIDEKGVSLKKLFD